MERIKLVRELLLTILVVALLGLCALSYVYFDAVRVSYRAVEWAGGLNRNMQEIVKQNQQLTNRINKLEAPKQEAPVKK